MSKFKINKRVIRGLVLVREQKLRKAERTFSN